MIEINIIALHQTGRTSMINYELISKRVLKSCVLKVIFSDLEQTLSAANIRSNSDYKPQSVSEAPRERCGHSCHHDGVGGLHTGGDQPGGGSHGGPDGGAEGRVRDVVTPREQDDASPGRGSRHVPD